MFLIEFYLVIRFTFSIVTFEDHLIELVYK